MSKEEKLSEKFLIFVGRCNGASLTEFNISNFNDEARIIANGIDRYEKHIADLEAKLAESEKKAYSRGHSQRDIANEIKLNALREDVANKEKRIVELKQQLTESEKSKELYRLQNEQHHLQLLQFYSRLGVEAFGADIHEKALETLMIMKEQLTEKEKEIEELKLKLDIRAISLQNFNIERMQANQNKISFAVEQLEQIINLFEPYENEEKDTILCANNGISFLEYIDNQIEELKKEMK